MNPPPTPPTAGPRPALLAALALAAGSAAHAQCEVQRLTGLEVAEDKAGFGLTLALSGDTAFVGWLFDENPYNGTGSCYVFERSALGWQRVARLYPDPAGIAGRFGTAAVSGDRAAITTYKKALKRSELYFYDRIGSTWQTVQVYSTGKLPDDEWGGSVAIDGDTAMVGFAKDNDYCPTAPESCWSGSVYVFARGPAGWGFRGKLTPSDPGRMHMFGAGLSLEGDRVAVGSLTTVFGEQWPGAVYVFDRDSTGAGVETAKLVADEDTGGNWFGLSVGLSGDRVVVGSQRQDSARGAAYVFEDLGGGWVQTAKLQATDGQPGDEFGTSVAIDGDRILVGAPNNDEAGPAAGAAYVFQPGAGGWVQTAKLRGEKTQENDWLGFAAKLEGDTALVSAPVVPWKQKLRYGAVHVFSIPAQTTPYCFGVGCPCGDDDGLRGCPNSTGRGALLAACGTTSVAADDLVLGLEGLPPHQPCVLLVGSSRRGAPFADGLACVGGAGVGLFSFPPRSSGGSGTVAFGPGLVAHSQAHFGAGAIDPGETWYFQGWYRDPAASCAGGLNLSNGLSATFEP